MQSVKHLSSLKRIPEPVKRSNLSADLTEHLMELIRSEHYQPGDRLPPIMEMARRFGVGQPTLREALRKLEFIGVVEIKHGSGVYIKWDQDLLLVSNPVFGGTVTKKMIVDLLETRMPIEIRTAELAATHATSVHLNRMKHLIDKAGQNLDNDAVLSPTNLTFHYEIAVASGNPIMAQLVDALMDQFKEEHRVILDVYGDRKKDHDEHVELLDAIERGDAALARQRMETHLEGVRAVLLQWDPKHNPLS